MILKPGALLEALCRSAENELVLVAPFVKARVVKRLLEDVDEFVKVVCVTRWRPEEIAAGVSDLEVWDVIKSRPHSELWLRPDLHAKYYRVENECLIGSANLTETALGWSTSPNLELLVPESRSQDYLITFEEELFQEVIRVDESVFEAVKKVVDLIRSTKPEPIPELFEVTSLEEPATSRSQWVPITRTPEHLYKVYSGQVENLSTAAHQSAKRDLQVLEIPTGFSKDIFEAYVATALLQMPIIRQIDAFVSEPQRFGAVAALLHTLPCANTSGFDAKLAWQTLMRWLMYFLPSHYNVTVYRYSEIISKVERR